MQSLTVRLAAFKTASIMNNPHKVQTRREGQRSAQTKAVYSRGVGAAFSIEFVDALVDQQGQYARCSTFGQSPASPAVRNGMKGFSEREACVFNLYVHHLFYKRFASRVSQGVTISEPRVGPSCRNFGSRNEYSVISTQSPPIWF